MPMRDEDTIRLAPSVHVVRRQDGLLLHCRRSGRTLRLSAAAATLLPPLQQGASLEGLVQQLKAAHPLAQGIAQKVRAFLAPLERHGMLAGADGGATAGRRAWPPRWVLVRSDAWLLPLVRALLAVPAPLRRAAFGVLLGAAAVSLATLHALGKWPGLKQALMDFDPRGLAIFAAVALCHELAHAVLCGMAGAPVRAAGIVWHGGLLPGPFVDTSHASYVASRWARFTIPAAGPIVDLLGAALCAAMLLWQPDPAWDAAWHSAFVVCVAFVFFDLNPLVASDGSHLLEAALDDELARQIALRPELATLTSSRTLRVYRFACVLWVTAMAAYFRWWW
jgi:putative peptide zinc metalloprotease protein